MLRKLVKYEWLSTVRIFGLCYLALLATAGVISLMTNGFHSDDGSVPFIILVIVYSILLGAVVFVTLYMIILRFYRNMLQGEGYLMHTLPVHEWQLIASKLILAVFWQIASILVVIISLMIITLPEIQDLISVISPTISRAMEEFYRSTGIPPVVYLILIIINILVSFTESILMFYLALSIGAQSNNHKKLFSFVAFIAIIVVLQALSGIFRSLGLTIDTTNLFVATELQELAYTGLSILLFDTGIAIVLSIIYFLGTEYLMRKRLNLE